MKKNLLIREDEIVKLVNEFYKKPEEFISILLRNMLSELDLILVV